MNAAELALRDAVEDAAHLEDVAVDALAEAVSWRALALVALAQAQEQFRRAELLERRIRQILGHDPWHTDAEMNA